MDGDVIREGDLVLTPGEFGRVDGHHSVYPRDEVEAVVGVSERDAAISERDRLRFDVQQLRDRLRRGEDIRPEQVAEMLGDMLEEP